MNDQFWQTFVSGIAVGSTYSMIALGFVLVFSATKILNFTQAAMAVAGAYLTYQFGVGWGLPFALAVVCAAVVCAGLSIMFERVVIRHIPASNHFAAIMATVGAMFVVEAIVSSIWGSTPLTLGDPWGLDTIEFGGVAIAVVSIWTIAVSSVLLGATFLIFKFTRAGLSMRATVNDPLAAAASGINLSRVRWGVWGAAGAAGGIAGMLLSTGSAGVHPTLGIVALAALPAMVFGGLDSPGGAIVGGLVIGLVQQFAALYQPQYLPFLGNGFPAISPYLVLIAALLLKPAGLFGNKAVSRF